MYFHSCEYRRNQHVVITASCVFIPANAALVYMRAKDLAARTSGSKGRFTPIYSVGIFPT